MSVASDLFEKDQRVVNRKTDPSLLVGMFRSHALMDPEVKNALLQTRTKLGLRHGPKYMLEIFSTVDASVSCYGLARRGAFDVGLEHEFKALALTLPEEHIQNTAIAYLERMLTYDDLTQVKHCEVGLPIRRGFVHDFCSTVDIESFVGKCNVESHWKIYL